VNGAKHGQKVGLSINVCKPRFYADLKAKQRRFLLMFKPNSSPIKVIGMVSELLADTSSCFKGKKG
jgi:hypothetical protein